MSIHVIGTDYDQTAIHAPPLRLFAAFDLFLVGLGRMRSGSAWLCDQCAIGFLFCFLWCGGNVFRARDQECESGIAVQRVEICI